MKKILAIIFFSFCLTKLGFCSDISLIDEHQANVQDNLTEEDDQDDIQEDVQEDEPITEDQFQDMNDFIKLENEKIKDIKLLNLDLQKADLQLKKKEIEQKINQLASGQIIASNAKNVNYEDDVNSRLSSLKLVSVFASGSDKKAVISMNGVNHSVIEGQVVDSVQIKSISSQKVVVQQLNGQTQELMFS